jgi:hypothetical protein
VTWHLKGRNDRARRNFPLLGNGSETRIAAMDTYATIEELLEVVFSMQSVARTYNENQQDKKNIFIREDIT